jgi:NADPH:quinone reductase-like Zn-dependent oxidoreductase
MSTSANTNTSTSTARSTTPETMNAITYRRYGAPSVVGIERIAKSVAGENEVLVRVRAASIGAADSAARLGNPAMVRLFSGLFTPRIPVLGSDFSGVIAHVGSEVTGWAVGDEVIGVTSVRMSAHAEYVTMPGDGPLVLKPADMNWEHAASLAELTALPFLRDGAKLTAGQRVLINGASGSVGVSAVQLAKHFGAHVTAVCSGANAELVRSIGADEVIDYTVVDFTAVDFTDPAVSTPAQPFDVVFDAVGKSSFRRCARLLTPTGIYLSTVPSVPLLVRAAFIKRARGRRAGILFTGLRKAQAQLADLTEIVRLAGLGVVVPVVDSSFDVANAAAAHARVDSGRKRGSVVVTFA